ncbi:hypothetical protein Tco_0935816 [Tanacetum coccineum]
MSNCLDYHEWKHQLLMERTWDSWKINDDDVIVVPHKDAQATLGDTNDLFTSISMSKDLADKDISVHINS